MEKPLIEKISWKDTKKKHSDEKVLCLRDCGKGFKTKKGLDYHMKLYAGLIYTPDKTHRREVIQGQEMWISNAPFVRNNSLKNSIWYFTKGAT